MVTYRRGSRNRGDGSRGRGGISRHSNLTTSEGLGGSLSAGYGRDWDNRTARAHAEAERRRRPYNQKEWDCLSGGEWGYSRAMSASQSKEPQNSTPSSAKLTKEDHDGQKDLKPTVNIQVLTMKKGANGAEEKKHIEQDKKQVVGGTNSNRNRKDEEYEQMEHFAARWSRAPASVAAKTDLSPAAAADKEMIKLLNAKVKELEGEICGDDIRLRQIYEIAGGSVMPELADFSTTAIAAREPGVYEMDGQRWYVTYVPLDAQPPPTSPETAAAARANRVEAETYHLLVLGGRSAINGYFARFPKFSFDRNQPTALRAAWDSCMEAVGIEDDSPRWHKERHNFFEACTREANEMMIARRKLHKVGYKHQVEEEAKWAQWLSGTETPQVPSNLERSEELPNKSMKRGEEMDSAEKSEAECTDVKECSDDEFDDKSVQDTCEWKPRPITEKVWDDDSWIWSYNYFSIYVNIFDYIEYLRFPLVAPKPTLYENEWALEDYCNDQNRFFSKKYARRSEMRRMLHALEVDEEELETKRLERKAGMKEGDGAAKSSSGSQFAERRHQRRLGHRLARRYFSG